MSAGAPWSVKGIDPKAREVAKDLARRSGMTLGEWLNRVILEDDLPEELTAETQFTDRLHRTSQSAPRLSIVPTSPDLARIAFALDRVTDRIEASETRTGLAINSVEHSVRQALARIESAEREQYAAANGLAAQLAETATEQSYLGERLHRLESEPGGPRSAEALRLMESRLARVEPEVVTEHVLERLGERLALAEARTSTALEDLSAALGTLDQRMQSIEAGTVGCVDQKFEALGQDLTRRVAAVRAEVVQKLEAAVGPEFETRFAAMSQAVRDAERRSTQAVEAIGRQVLSMAEAVGRKLGEVDQRSADAIDQVGTEVARIAGAVELRLARGEHLQAEAFERLGAELSRVTATLTSPSSDVQDFSVDLSADIEVATPEFAELQNSLASETEPDPQIAALLAEARERLGPPPEPEPETALPMGLAKDAGIEPAISADAPLETAAAASSPFGAELFSRAEVDSAPASETFDAPWHRLDLDVPEDDTPEVFAPIVEHEDEALFAPPQTSPHEPELSTREGIARARATARAANGTGRVDVSAKVEGRAATGRLFQGFGAKPKARRQSTTLQTALMVAGGAAFLSVGAAGLTLMQGPAPQPRQDTEVSSIAPRAAVARSTGNLAPPGATAALTAPVYEQVRSDVEAGIPGAVGRLKALAEADHPQAQLYLAQLYDLGEAGLVRDPVEARRLISLSAENGDRQAMHNLGVFYFRGEGGPQDLNSAAQWFRKAADGGVVESQYNLGLLYQSGSGVRRDLDQARHWFGQAAAKGDAEARLALAAMTTTGVQPGVRAPPTSRKPVATTSQNVRQTQLILSRLGYYSGPADGISSDSYRTALMSYQSDMTNQRSEPRPYTAQR